MKFDVVVGNPPYQENNDNRNRDDSIYPFFYDISEKLAKRYCIISPARFLFGVGSTSSEWNNKMLNDKHLKVVYFNQNSSDIFPNADIKGGIVILHRDENRNFGKIGTFTAFNELNRVLDKVLKSGENFKNNLSDLMHVQTKFNLTKLYEDYPGFKERIGSKGKEKRLTSSIFETLPEIFLDNQNTIDFAKIYGRNNNERCYKWVNTNYLETTGNFSSYKVFVPAANGSGAIGEVLSTPVIGFPVIGFPVIGHTQTFISIGSFETEFEAQSLLKYLKGKFARTMLGIKKTTQNNKTKETWSKVPLQDFTENSDIDWTQSIADIDRQLYKKYNLDENEINFIEEKVKTMN